MSRSKKGGKPPGYEFWSKRPCSMMGTGPVVKQMTHEKERMEAKENLNKQVKEMDKELDD